MRFYTVTARGAAAVPVFIFCLVLGVGAYAQEKEPVQYVNTLQGTDSRFELSYGNTFPAAGLPFGMHLWSAQTGKNGDGWKYQYAANTIRGFQQAHQCSPWTLDYGVFSLMPVAGELVVDQDKRAATFSHANETAGPHYYRVKFDNGITTEMSPTERGAHFRFRFTKKGPAFLVLDGYTQLSAVHISPNRRRITGFVNNQRYAPKSFKAWFVAEFDQPVKNFGTWENRGNTIGKGDSTREGEGAGAWLEFAKGATVQVKVASSYISIEQAQRNLDRELGKFRRLEETRDAAAKAWNALLGRVKVEGGTEEQKATFYSCLFRASLFSRQFYEYDENDRPVYWSPYDAGIHAGYMYTDNGFWDTFRSQFPLTNILHPTMQGRYMQALLDAQKQCGWLPSWSFPGETGAMVGNHSISLLTDAWMKGIRSFNPDSALKAYAHEAMNKGPWGGANGRGGWKEYWQLGFVPYPQSQGSTAQTLEYAYDDFCAWQLARACGNKFYEEIFARTMYNYRNVYDPAVGFMRGRGADGKWSPAVFNPYEWGGPFVEGNAWHYSWSVFHDVQGLIGLMGGEKAFTQKIDSVFTNSDSVHYGSYGSMIHEMKEMVVAGMGQYAQGNQPIQHLVYLYAYAGQPWKTQARVREIMDRLYNAGVRGYPGDEDQGGMSSWYVLSALGIYSVCPGTDQYVLGSPVFNKTTITLENGKQFVIEAKNNSRENIYIRRAWLNGNEYSKNWITYSDIAAGGVLQLEMGASPETTRGTAPVDRPFSLSAANN